MLEFLGRVGKRIFSYTIDAYFVFRAGLDEDSGAKRISLPPGYTTGVIRSEADEAFTQLCDMWQEAYYKDGKSDKALVQDILKKMFEAGDICCCLFHQEKLVGMDWVGFAAAIRRLPFAHYVLNESSTSIGHHMFISKSHRGKHLQLGTDALRKQVSRKEGAVSQYVFVGVKNFASVRNMMQCHHHYRLIYHVKVEVPLASFNLFPGGRGERWIPCDSR